MSTIYANPSSDTPLPVAGGGTGSSSPYAKNYIKGGDFGTNPWQQALSFSASTTFTADFWRTVTAVTPAQITVTRTADAPAASDANYFTNYCMKAAVTTQDASIGSTDLMAISNTIEGYDIAPCYGQVMTLSFWIKATITGTSCVCFKSTGGNRSYPVEFTINSSNTWEYKTITLTMDPYNASYWQYGSGVGLYVQFALAGGSNYQGTNATWATANYYCTASQVNHLSSTSNVYQLALVCLNLGASAQPFECRTVGQELAFAQRNYYKTFPEYVSPDVGAGTGYAVGYICVVSGVSNAYHTMTLPVPMRFGIAAGNPTVTFYNPSNSNAKWYNYTQTVDSGTANAFLVGSATLSDTVLIIRNPQVAGDVAGQLIMVSVSVDFRF